MIIEGVLTTLNDNGSPNIAAMGGTLEPSTIGPDGLWTTFQLRPFEGSRTFHNLSARPFGVFHLIDNAELLARAALSEAENTTLIPAQTVQGFVMAGAVRAYEFQLQLADWSRPRATLGASVVHSHNLREWSGWNRAQNAVLELTIMATRVGWTPRNVFESQIESLTPLIEKTAGEHEKMAWNFVLNYLEKAWSKSESTGIPKR
jgi:hypothetical protein